MLETTEKSHEIRKQYIQSALLLGLSLGLGEFGRKSPPWLCFSTCQEESLTKQWTYGPT